MIADALAQHWSTVYALPNSAVPVLPSGSRRASWDRCGFTPTDVVSAVRLWERAGALTIVPQGGSATLDHNALDEARIYWHPPGVAEASQPSLRDSEGAPHPVPARTPGGPSGDRAPPPNTGPTGLPRPPQAPPRRPLVLLDLFAGTTLAREAVDEMLRFLDPEARLSGSHFVEVDSQLQSAAALYWGRQADHHGKTPHRPLTSDVWDLFRRAHDTHLPQDTPLARVILNLPEGALVLLAAGSPCQDLSPAGRLGGRLGLLGPRSKHFWAVPLCAWYIRTLRPDLLVHVLLENVDSMRPEHRAVLLRALALDPQVHATVLDAKTWGPLPRRRLWAATFPPPSADYDTLRWERRIPPWEPGWRFNPRGEPPLSTRARGVWNGDPIPSTFYLHPKHLLYRSSASFPWDLMSPDDACRQMERLLEDADVQRAYPHAREGLEAILQGQDRTPEMEPSALDFARWLIDHGRDVGARPLSADERADATGYGYFFRDQGLSGRLLYDAVGTHFDPCSFQRRCFPLLRAWHDGRLPDPPVPLHPDELVRAARGLHAIVSRNCPNEDVCDSPIPADVAANLRLAGIWLPQPPRSPLP